MKKTGLFLCILLITAFLAGCTSPTNLSLTIPTPGNASAVTWMPSGDAVVSNGFHQIGSPGSAGSIGVWAIADNQLASSLISSTDTHKYLWVSRLSFDKSGNLLLITTPYIPGSSNGFVSLYDFKQNTLVQIWEGLNLDDNPEKVQESIQDAAFSPDGTKFAIAGSFQIRIFDSENRQELTRIPVNARGGTIKSGDERLDVSINWSSDGTKLGWLVLSQLQYYNMSDGTVAVVTGDFPAPNKRFAWSPDGKSMVFENEGNLSFVDIASGALTRSTKIVGSYEDTHVKSIQYSPDGKYLAFCSSEYTAIWDTISSTLILELSLNPEKLEMNRYENIAWSPDSQNLAILSYGAKQILIYNLTH